MGLQQRGLTGGDLKTAKPVRGAEKVTAAGHQGVVEARWSQRTVLGTGWVHNEWCSEATWMAVPLSQTPEGSGWKPGRSKLPVLPPLLRKERTRGPGPREDSAGWRSWCACRAPRSQAQERGARYMQLSVSAAEVSGSASYVGSKG